MSNALAAAAVAIGLGADVDKTAAALSRAVLRASGRMEVTDRSDGVRIVNDAFNANPDSMKAAFTTLEAMADGRRTIALLGEMKELGARRRGPPRGWLELAAATGFHVLIAVGGDDASAKAATAQQDNPQLAERVTGIALTFSGSSRGSLGLTSALAHHGGERASTGDQQHRSGTPVRSSRTRLWHGERRARRALRVARFLR